MSRLQQKCLYASVATHGLLLALLFVGPAFVPSQKPPPPAVLTFIPSKAVDAALFSGGSPTASAQPAGSPPPPAAEVPPPPVPAPPVAEASPPRTEIPRAEVPSKAPPPEPELSKPAKDGFEPVKKAKTPKAPPRDEAPDKSTKPATDEKSGRRKIEPVLVESKETSARLKAESKAAARARAQHDAQVARQQAFAKSAEQWTGKVGAGLSSGTSIDMPPGPGGEAFADYRLIVRARYERAWIPPGELDEESAVVQARVVIRRDGTVVDARVTKPSRDRALDRSVERALQLRSLPPFPEEAKDAERTFLINFDLKTKRLLG